MPELRRDPITGERVVVASERAKRPSDFASHSPGREGGGESNCPFCLDDPPYSFNIHTAPCDRDEGGEFHWHLAIAPRLTIAAGFEMGTGIYIGRDAPGNCRRVSALDRPQERAHSRRPAGGGSRSGRRLTAAGQD